MVWNGPDGTYLTNAWGSEIRDVAKMTGITPVALTCSEWQIRTLETIKNDGPVH